MISMHRNARSLNLRPWASYLLGVSAGILLFGVGYLALGTDVAARWGGRAVLITAKLRGRGKDCPWAVLLRTSDRGDSFGQRKEELMRQMHQQDIDLGWGISKYQMPGRSFWIRTSGTKADGPELLSYLYADHQTMTTSPTEHVSAGDTVIDIGAHVGVFTHLALAAGAARVVMLEPDPVNVECLKRNFREEIASGRVILVPEGAWDAESTLQFHTGVSNSGAGSFVGNQQGSKTLEARVRPVDSMVAELGLQRVDMVKIDIEGAERYALKGMQGVLRKWKPRLLIDTYHRPDDPQVLPALIHEANPGYLSACQSCDYRPVDGSVEPHVTLYY